VLGIITAEANASAQRELKYALAECRPKGRRYTRIRAIITLTHQENLVKMGVGKKREKKRIVYLRPGVYYGSDIDACTEQLHAKA
jgi:hypothetical protein